MSIDELLDWFFPKLIDEVSRRYQTTAEKTLLDVYRLDPGFLTVDEETVRFGYENRERLLQLFETPQTQARLLHFFVNTTLEFTYQNNQFIPVNEQDQQQLYNIYQVYLQRIGQALANSQTPSEFKTSMESAVAEHFQALRTNLTRFFDPTVGLPDNLIFQQAVCAEYTPALQLELFGIQPGLLEQPVLDLGCGKTGQLVRFLNERGIETFGVDRLVEPSRVLTQADWLRFSFQPERWGTVISHMGFSNHFIFHHLYKGGEPFRYARQYMSILASLKPGGTFYYAPGLPFMEKLLPLGQYELRRRMVRTEAVTIDKQEGQAGIPVSAITKLASK